MNMFMSGPIEFKAIFGVEKVALDTGKKGHQLPTSPIDSALFF